MSRYAREFANSHESPRLAAAIIGHLKSRGSGLPLEDQLSDTTQHWMDLWNLCTTPFSVIPAKAGILRG
jgi:hypothetical protein